MRTLLAFIFCLLTATAHAATPAFSGFYGSGGVTVTTNPLLGTVTIGGGSQTNVSASTTPGAAITNLVWANTAFVDNIYGTNATAAIGDATKPYRDPWAAAHAASNAFVTTGRRQLVWVRQGSYNTNDLLRNGVDYFVQGDLTFTNKLALTNGGPVFPYGIFDDRQKGGVTSSIVMLGDLIYDAVAVYSELNELPYPGSTNDLGPFNLTNANSVVQFSGKKIRGRFLFGEGSAGSFVTIKNCRRLDMTFNAIIDDGFGTSLQIGEGAGGPVYAVAAGNGLWWELGDSYITCSEIKAQEYALYASHPQALSNVAGNLWLTFDKMQNGGVGSTLYIVGIPGGTNGWRTWIRGKEISGPGALSVVAIYTSGRHYLEGFEKISGGGGPLVAVAGANTADLQAWLGCQKLSAGNAAGWVTMDGVTNVNKLTLEVDEYEDAGMGIGRGISCTGGQLYLKGGTASTTNSYVLKHTGGFCKVNGMTMIAGVTNECVLVNANGLVLQNCSFSNNPARFALSTSVNATNHVKLLGCFGTSDMTNKLTNAVGPYTISTFVQ